LTSHTRKIFGFAAIRKIGTKKKQKLISTPTYCLDKEDIFPLAWGP
jgi:hypothetical protein